MKIFAYEVRADEIEYFERLRQVYGVEIQLSGEVPGPNNAALTAGCEGVTMLGQGRIDAALLDLYHSFGVRYLSTRTIGYNHIDIEHAKKIGIHVCNADYAPNGVAEYTIMLMLLCLRCYKPALWRINVNDFSLGGLRGRELRNLTVGVVGTGSIGKQVIRTLQGFGCRILAYSRHPSADVAAEYVDLDTLYAQSDLVTYHTALTPETFHMVDRESIAKMKDGVIIVNSARGPLMDSNALVEAVERGKIGALGLDCIEKEEGIYHKNHRDDILCNRDMAYLRQFPNVVMTPHMAFYTDAAVESMVQCGVEGILDMARTGQYRNMLV